MPKLHLIDYIIIVLTLVISVGIGVWFSARQTDTKQYFKAGGNLPSWAIGLSILATLISSVTFLAYPGEGFSSNWILLVQGLMVPIVLVLIIGFVVPLYRKVINLSAYEYFEKRFGLFARIYSSLAFALVHFAKMGTVLYLLGLAISSLIGIDTIAVIWGLGICVIILTLLGGIEAVIWLDVVQGILLIVGGIITLIILISSIDGGISEIMRVASENGRTGFGPYDLDFYHLTFIVMALNGVFYALQKYGTDQTIVQRYLTAKSDKEAIRASLIGVLLSVPVWALFMFIGTALFVYYQTASAGLPADIKPDEVFPYFISTSFPVGLAGFVISALIAAAISSLDSDLNCLSAVYVEDYYKRFKPKSTERDQMRAGRITVAVSGILALLVATTYVTAGNKGVLGIVFTLYAIFSGGIVGMFLLGLFTTKANKQGLLIGIIACVLFTAYALLTSTPIGIEDKRLLLDLGSWNFEQHKYMLGVYSHLLVFGVGYLASLFFKEPEADIALTYYGRNR
ncbi:sodium:solute symporter [Flavilitoribacter nigricans]|uniref:Sodium transporter n=1 Tax=Flavilitoribacter nigricans (strain ATCC 23147 / DSM 23189 / NBRC 102662 / NCIMB 1420 / SS-2) TaxID=1122177 RepID=A0A2D0N1W4_FLAN2|nr:sodium:solute symporter [Flavilitoribacter nigricans]PHN02447.1 sodium transporter [Flavilitoribacter nigricans DSM 23189 = NBRC 102662]